MTQEPPGLSDYVLLITLAAIWGGSFMVIKLAIETVPPITMTAARVVISAAIFLAIVAITGRRLPGAPHVWGWGFAVALFGLALPFSLIAWGEEKIDSGVAAILMAGMPLATLLLARLTSADEPLTGGKLAGVGFGMVGLVILIGPQKLTSLGEDMVRELAIVLASFSYAVNAVVTKRIAGYDPYAVSAVIMIAGTLLLVPASLLIDAPWTLNPTPVAWLALILLGVFATAAGSILMLAILRRQGAGFFGQINFLVPLFGVASGVVVLSERLPASAFLALAVILVGIAIARRKPGFPRAAFSEQPK